MDQDQVEIVLDKIFPVIKPDEVNKIIFDVRQTAPNEFTLHTLLIVPDEMWDSFDHINKAAFIHDVKVKLRQKIKSYTDLNIVFDKDNTAVMKQSDFQKEYEIHNNGTTE
jgi:hypothetical protein